MLKAACIALSVSMLVLGMGSQVAHAGWSDTASRLKSGASSMIVSIKKDKNDHDDHHGKKNKKKNTDEGAGLSECTIQQSGGGGGCKDGFKRVCEKMKSGKKCCGCVPNKSQGTTAGQSAPTGGGGIKPIDEKPADTLLLPYFECDLSKGEPCDLKPK